MESARLCTAHVVLLAQSRFRILDDRTFQVQVHFGWEPKPTSVSLYTMYTREHLRHRQGGRLSFHIISLSPALPLNVELVPQYMTWESFPMWQGKLHSTLLQCFILNHLAARPLQRARGFLATPRSLYKQHSWSVLQTEFKYKTLEVTGHKSMHWNLKTMASSLVRMIMWTQLF